MSCTRQLFTVEKTQGERTTSIIINYATGYHSLPEEGGMLDQPYRMMAFWSYFLEGDRLATFKRLK